jgi:hypothetical protein
LAQLAVASARPSITPPALRQSATVFRVSLEASRMAPTLLARASRTLVRERRAGEGLANQTF